MCQVRWFVSTAKRGSRSSIRKRLHSWTYWRRSSLVCGPSVKDVRAACMKTSSAPGLLSVMSALDLYWVQYDRELVGGGLTPIVLVPMPHNSGVRAMLASITRTVGRKDQIWNAVSHYGGGDGVMGLREVTMCFKKHLGWARLIPVAAGIWQHC